MSLRPEEHERRVRLGICLHCPMGRDNIPPPGKKCCKACVDKITQLRADRLRDGLCGKCGKRPRATVNGKLFVLCKPCLSERRIQQAADRPAVKAKTDRLRKARARDGLCVRCPKADPQKARPGLRTCQRCGDYQAKFNGGRAEDKKALLDAGICVDCGQDDAKQGATICAGCSNTRQKKEERRRSERLEKDLCAKCGEHPRQTIQRPGQQPRLGKHCITCAKKRNDVAKRARRNRSQSADRAETIAA